MNVTLMPDEMHKVLLQLFTSLGFSNESAKLLANTHTESTMCGVNSHGLNRVPIFTKYVREGLVNPSVKAIKVEAFGQIERWDGQFGSGIINATTCTARAIEMAKKSGMGLVALKNTNHWMRAGSYGAQAAKAGCIGIMFTNTQSNMPPWGGTESRLGNNPLVVSIPNGDNPIVLDMAMSQFSFGKIHEYHLRSEDLPVAGGWDENNQISTDPKAILASEKSMPTGYWKGSALSMVLDMLATLLSAGNSTKVISQSARETGVSQVFLCIDTALMNQVKLHKSLLTEIIDYTKNVNTHTPDTRIKYPGQRAHETYKISKAQGMQVSQKVWNEVVELSISAARS